MKQVDAETVMKVNGCWEENGSECPKDMENGKVPEVCMGVSEEIRGMVEKVEHEIEQVSEEITRVRISSDGTGVVDKSREGRLKVDPVKRANALKGRQKASRAQKASGWGNIHPDAEMRSTGQIEGSQSVSGGNVWSEMTEMRITVSDEDVDKFKKAVNEGITEVNPEMREKMRNRIEKVNGDADSYENTMASCGIPEDVILGMKSPRAPAVKSLVSDIARGHDPKVTAQVLAIVDYYERILVGKDTTIRNLQRSVGTRRYW